jgi:N-acetylglucosaminyldiphosphoundecaprenol N-acetyl-beta-D-mannosaminyltransferase
MSELETEKILGHRVLCTGADTCCDTIIRWLSIGDRCRWLACINPHSHITSVDDSDFGAALKEADWLLPDGSGIVLASRILGGRVRTRVTGSDVFSGIHSRLNISGGTVFLLGSTPETLALIQRRLAREYPNIRVGGVLSPPFAESFSEEQTQTMISAINRSGADVLWVGMTAPKQEKWISQNRHRLKAKFAGAVGAVFDFYSGRIKRSPKYWQQMGLEWLPRLIQEPRRLWRRNFVSSPRFLLDVLRSKFCDIDR